MLQHVRQAEKIWLWSWGRAGLGEKVLAIQALESGGKKAPVNLSCSLLVKSPRWNPLQMCRKDHFESRETGLSWSHFSTFWGRQQTGEKEHTFNYKLCGLLLCGHPQSRLLSNFNAVFVLSTQDFDEVCTPSSRVRFLKDTNFLRVPQVIFRITVPDAFGTK